MALRAVTPEPPFARNDVQNLRRDVRSSYRFNPEYRTVHIPPMGLNSLTFRLESAVYRVKAAHLHSRGTTVNRRARAAASDSPSVNNLNRVLFTIPWKVQYGQSLSLSGEGEELGQWSPDKSLPLKWNDGDLWAAEIPLPVGQKVEYKYVVKDSSGCLQAWQPGGNCAVAVPIASDASLQVADDWHGKSRSVIFKNGDVESAPAGTFDGPPAQTSPRTKLPEPHSDSASHTASHSQSAKEETSVLGTSLSQPDTTSEGAYAHSSQQVDEAAAKAREAASTESATEQYESDAMETALLDDTTGAPLDELTVKDLKDRLKDLGLLVSGRKSELVDRLAAAKTTDSE